MTTLREAAQQALEALESLFTLQVDYNRPKQSGDAITALKAALEQPQDCAECNRWQIAVLEQGEVIEQLKAALEQPEQEPVAWIHSEHYLLGHAENMPPADKALAQGWKPLYTHPPRCEWRGLTEEEVDAVWEEAQVFNTHYDIARAIEAKLKELNNE